MSEQEEFIQAIRAWKHHWMNKEPGYFERAFNIDANMVHDLARRLVDRKVNRLALAAQEQDG